MQHFPCTLRNIWNKTKKGFLLTNWSLPFVTSQRVHFSNCMFVAHPRGEQDEWTDCPRFLGDVRIVSRNHWWRQFCATRGPWTPPRSLTSRTLSGTTRSPFIRSKLVQFSSIKTRLLARLYSLFLRWASVLQEDSARVEARHWVGAAGMLVRYRSSAGLRKVLLFQKNLPTISSPT